LLDQDTIPSSKWGEYYKDYATVCAALEQGTAATISEEALEHHNIYRLQFKWATARRRFFTTQNGYFGLAPEDACANDIVCIIGGAQTPYILREHNGCYQVIGECYVHGLMDGEALELEDFKPEMLPLC